jgi:hypothetical protein
MDKIYLNDTPIYLEEAVSLGAGFTGGAISGTTGYFSGTLGAAGTTGLNYTTVTDIRASDDGYFAGDLTAGTLAAFNYTTVTDLRASDDIYAAHLMALLTNLNATTTTSLVNSGYSYLNGTTVTNGYASGTHKVAGISSLNGTTVTYLTDSGAASIGGILGVTGLADLNATEVTSIVNSGYSYLNGTSVTSAYSSGGLNVAGTSALNVTTATTVTATGLVQGADGRFTDDFLVDSDAFVDGTATVQDLAVNNTTNLKQPIYYDTYACVTNTTISDSSIYSTFVIGNSTGYGQTMTLPTASAAIGMTIKFIVDVEPDTNDIVIDGSGDETINGAATKTSSEQWAVLEVYCDGTEWYVTDSIGTWN